MTAKLNRAAIADDPQRGKWATLTDAIGALTYNN
jgi:hypothetical protein